MALFYHTSAFSQIIFDAGGCPDRRVRQPILFQEKTALQPAWQFPRQAAFHIFTGNAVLSKIEQTPLPPMCAKKSLADVHIANFQTAPEDSPPAFPVRFIDVPYK